MQLSLTFPVISLWLLLVLTVGAQDIRPEYPEDFPRPTTEESILTTEEGTTEEPTASTPIEEASTPAPAEEATTSASTEEAMSAGSAEDATTPAPTAKPATTTKEPITTTTTEAPTTTKATAAPPSYIPPYAPPTNEYRPTYTTRNPWILNEQAERCYLKEQKDYGNRNGVCAPWVAGSWRPSISCYRCCYFSRHNVAGCSKLHRGRCGGYYYYY
ncbi:olfactomedin-like protein 2B [Drosophila guanche]|uniref:Blast:SET and MYND domain-containing protein 4 n=1 Tax=Drosophila guanche TaxID=7266 RepID=A0A3B0JK66_DROGU|nr:olfactomedin-like protein 2B [Drosophila guanche]SPP73849.1 blast:SET and MYND domain-containing protein 4 [Drosophila guanche]